MRDGAGAQNEGDKQAGNSGEMHMKKYDGSDQTSLIKAISDNIMMSRSRYL